MAELEKESDASGEVHARLRQENLQLVHRANALEEQLKEQEVYAEECLEQEERRHKEALAKMERDLGLELENLQTRWVCGWVCVCVPVYVYARESVYSCRRVQGLLVHVCV